MARLTGGNSNKFRAEMKARYAHLLPAKKPRPMSPPYDPTGIVLGLSEKRNPVVLPERPRLEHLHVIGATGSGKTNFLQHCIRQDITRGRGVCVIDPHGNHPDSLYRSLIAWLDERGLAKTRTIHLIDPNAATHTVGFNPLERPDGETDLSVIASATLEAFERVWGDEDTHSKPTIRRVLKATFVALAELGLTLSEAELLFDPHDAHGVRALALQKLTDRYARSVLQELHQMALDDRSKRDFRAEVVGPINRLAEFVSAPAMRRIVGQRKRTLDLRAALDEGHIILANLAGGQRVADDDAELLGRLLTRFLFFHAKRRQKPEVPFFFYLDECQRYLSGDVPELLGEARKFGLAVIASHQWLAQLGKPEDPIYAAMLNGPNLRAVFRLKDPKEAESLAEAVMPLDLERPVAALVKPTVVGHRRTRFRAWGRAEHEAHSTASATTRSEGVTESEADTEVQSNSESVSESLSDSSSDTAMHSATSMSAHGVADMASMGSVRGEGASAGETMTPERGWFSGPEVLSTSAGESAMSAASAGSTHSASSMAGVSSGDSGGHTAGRSRAAGTSSARGASRAHMRAHAFSSSVSQTEAEAHMRGTSQSESESEGLEPVYRDLPSAVHSRENVRYLAAQLLRSLPTGQGLLAYVGAGGWLGTRLTVPELTAPNRATFEAARTRMLDASPSALPVGEAMQGIAEREQRLVAAAQTLRLPPPEPGTFRVPAPKRKADATRLDSKPRKSGAQRVKGGRSAVAKGERDP